MNQPDAPWTVVVADGSGNRWRFEAVVGGEVTVAYLPVTPAESSSGTYSGGAPTTRTLTQAQTASLWAHVRAIVADVDHQIQQRRMGTVALSVATAHGTTEVLASGGADVETIAWCRELTRP